MDQFIRLVCEMSPFLLLGFLLAGVMHAFIPVSLYGRCFAAPGMRSVVWAALFGIPLPLCSCGVLPAAMSLRREGAGRGATVSFLIATPQTGIDSIVATYSMMGLPFAIVRPLAALVTALLGGCLTDAAGSKRSASATDRSYDEKPLGAAGGGKMGDGEKRGETHENNHDGCRRKRFERFFAGLMEALRYAYVDMMESVGKWLVVGLVVAGVLTVAVPDSCFELFSDNSLMSMLLVLCLSVPMYLCATGSIPIAVALMMKGLTPGAALVMLMAGPACSVASVLLVGKILGRRTLAVYLFSIVLGAMTFGLAVDHLMPRSWFVSDLTSPDWCCHEGVGLLGMMSALLLALLLVNALVWRRFAGRLRRGVVYSSTSPALVDGSPERDGAGPDVQGQTFVVGGMSCSHCCQSVVGVVRTVEGVTAVSVDLDGGELRVEGDFSASAVCQAVEEIGFTCTLKAAGRARK